MTAGRPVVMVTGAAGGLGGAVCRRWAAEGAIVVAADVDEGGSDKTVAAIEEDGGEAHPLVMDVTDPDDVDGGIGWVTGSFGRIDGVVNSAGTDHTAPCTDLTVAQWDRIIGVNLTGPFLVSRRVIPAMAGQTGGGHIVNIASTAAKRAWSNAAAYHASKWGLLGFSHALHVEGRARGVRVTAVIAGGMRTPFLLDRFPDIDPAVLQEPDDVAEVVWRVMTAPSGTVVPEVTVLPVHETSWP